MIDTLYSRSKLVLMKKSLRIAISGAFGLLILALGWTISVNNTLISLNEVVQEKWSQVENVYQRRADLIPNLVNTVKGYTKHESQVLEEVTNSRAKAGALQIKVPEDLKNFDSAQSHLSQALSRLLAISENYPDLKADRSFLELQSQLEGTENRITIERMRFNQATQEYNAYLKKFPQSVVAGLRQFKVRPYFEADKSAYLPPKVEF